jgi:hypothetical protein
MAPLNDLEQLLAKPRFGPRDYPEMFRLLRDASFQGHRVSVKRSSTISS